MRSSNSTGRGGGVVGLLGYSEVLKSKVKVLRGKFQFGEGVFWGSLIQSQSSRWEVPIFLGGGWWLCFDVLKLKSQSSPREILFLGGGGWVPQIHGQSSPWEVPLGVGGGRVRLKFWNSPSPYHWVFSRFLARHFSCQFRTLHHK